MVPWAPQTDGFSDNVHPEQMIALLKHVDKTLSSPENAFLDPVEREIERSKLFADVLVAYARLVMGRPDVQTPFEGESAVRPGLELVQSSIKVGAAYA